MHKVVLLTAVIAAFVSARPTDGTCRNDLQLKANFDTSKFAGTWFQLFRDQQTNTMNENGNCAQTSYAPNPDGTL